MLPFDVYQSMKVIYVCCTAFFLLMSVLPNLFVYPEPTPLALLGHRLFFETKLSINGTKSCATCHAPELAFTDGYRQSLGVFADKHPRNALSLLNLDSYHSLNWTDSQLVSITKQLQGPIFGIHPIEMGLTYNDTAVIEYIFHDSMYRDLWNAAFPLKNKPDFDGILAAISAYTSGLISRNSSFDQHQMSEEAMSGYQLFESARLGCRKCHSGRDFNQPIDGIGNDFHDIGFGRVRTPSLRNVAITAPYLSDGSIGDLRSCVKIFTHHVQLSDSEQHELLAFLYSLTDTTYLANPYFTDPFSH